MKEEVGKTYSYFREQFNHFEDTYLEPLIRGAVDFAELPANDKIEPLSKLFSDTKASMENIIKDMKCYLQSGMSDIKENELHSLITYIDELADSVRFEAETINDIIDDEMFTAAFALEQLRKDGEIITT